MSSATPGSGPPVMFIGPSRRMTISTPWPSDLTVTEDECVDNALLRDAVERSKRGEEQV